MSSAPPPVAPAPAAPPLPAAWPRSAQFVTAALLLLATLLFAFHGLASWRGASRPTDLRQGPAPERRIDLNQAGRAELLQLPGVGRGLAQQIEEERQKRGGFHSVEELREVKGVGPTMLARLRPLVGVRGEDAGGESAPPAKASPRKASVPSQSSSPGKTAKLAGPVNVNRATLAELQTLPGIGPKMAQRILDERGRGRFKSVDDLRRVSGIGAKTLDRLRPYVTVEEGGPVKVVTATDDVAN